MLCERRSSGSTLEALAGRDGGVTWREVHIDAHDGVRLDAYLVRPTGVHRTDCVVILHGIGDSRGAGSAGFVSMFPGYTVLLPDIRGHGTSGGDVVTFGVAEKDDAIRWARWLRVQNGCTRVYGLGESLGGAILIQAAATEPAAFEAIVAECPFADLQSIAEYRVAQIVPAWVSRLLVSGSLLYARAHYGTDLSQASPLLAMPGAGHVAAAATAPREFRERVLGWFGQPD